MAEIFIADPKSENFAKLIKAELVEVATKFGVKSKPAMKKREMQRLIIEYCIEKYDRDHKIMNEYPDQDAENKERNYQI